jgi:hypothetical protein
MVMSAGRSGNDAVRCRTGKRAHRALTGTPPLRRMDPRGEACGMTIGASVFCIAVGAIPSFAY